MTEQINDAHYYRRREQDQRLWADLARSPAIRNLHLDLADRFRELAQEAELKQTGQDEHPPSHDAAAS